jgi:hypothetical protein
MALITHNRLLNILVNDFSEVDEAMFKVVKGLFQLNFCIPSVEKSDLEQVA